jgi:hypothetical protein
VRREGLPIASRQLMLREQGVLELTIQCAEKPYSTGQFMPGDDAELRNLGRLAMRLVRHVLRAQPDNKRNALPLVPSMLKLLSFGFGTSEALTELFVDNEHVVMVSEEICQMFVDLIRNQGRNAAYLRFLEVLCVCRGKAIRPNQWRVASLLLEGAPELLLKLRLNYQPRGSKVVMVSGDPSFFPRLSDGELPLCEWLDTTEPENVEYFEGLTSLYAALVRGRNLRTTPTLQSLLPYELVLGIITDAQLNIRHLGVSRQFVTIARDLYVNNDLFGEVGVVNEAHPKMVSVKHVRIWTQVPVLGKLRVLSSRFNCDGGLIITDWSRYDDLKSFALRYISMFYRQNATELAENAMILELVKLLHELVKTGFYRASELAGVVGPLLKLLDGRNDTMVWKGRARMSTH